MATGASGRIVTQTSKVLIVDDEPIIRGVLVDVLLDAGFAVSSASNGLIALSVLEECPSWTASPLHVPSGRPIQAGHPALS